jgi:hypothetical protein
MRHGRCGESISTVRIAAVTEDDLGDLLPLMRGYCDFYEVEPSDEIAEALIEECRVRAGRRGATSLGWQTAKDNLRAQKVYERVGGRRQEWLDYSLET